MDIETARAYLVTAIQNRAFTRAQGVGSAETWGAAYLAITGRKAKTYGEITKLVEQIESTTDLVRVRRSRRAGKRISYYVVTEYCLTAEGIALMRSL